MKEVDRADFTDFLPYTDCPTPISETKNLSSPHMHAIILELMKKHLIGK
jgi:protein-L-isoaspartate O-methyltransferase